MPICAGSRRPLRAGAVGRPHGLDGSFHVLQPIPDLLILGTAVAIGGRTLAIERRAGTDRRPIVRLEGAKNRSDALALGGEPMLVARPSEPELGPDEWWAEELEGCVVHDAERALGVVRRLLALPSCEVLEVARAGGGDDLLVPLVRDAVRQVDVQRRRIEIDLEFLGGEPDR